MAWLKTVLPIHQNFFRWGDYRKCDTPLRTIEAMYKHIASHHSIDLIYWTGDLPPHDIWKQSRDGNVEVESELFLAVKKCGEFVIAWWLMH